MQPRIVAPFLFAISLIACGGGPSTDSETHWQDNQGDDNSHSGYTPAATIEIEDHGHFGQVPPGETKSLTFTILLASDFPIDGYFELTDLSIDSDAFTVNPPFDSWPDTLRHDEPIQGQITFAPVDNMPQNVAFTIEGNPVGNTIPMENKAIIYLRANPPCIDLGPGSSLLFSALSPGEVEDKSLTITNCSAAVEFHLLPSIDARTAGGPIYFALHSPPSFPYHLAPGQTLELTIRYTANDPEQDWATLYLENENPDLPYSQRIGLQSEAYNPSSGVVNQDEPGPGENHHENDYENDGD